MHAVYRFFDAGGRLLYIGATSSMASRISHHERNTPWWSEVARIETTAFPRRADAFAAERAAISAERPLHNARRAFAPVDRTERMLSAYVNDDMTLEQIGQRHGITRERVRQLTSAADRTMCLLVIRRRDARSRLRRLVNAGSPSVLTCMVCGSVFEGDNRRRFCSPVHSKVAVLMRYQTDDTYRERHRLACARWAIRSESESASQVRYAQRLIAGTTVERSYRWLVPGSLQFHWALRAHALGWPLFDAFHEDVQRQIREAAG